MLRPLVQHVEGAARRTAAVLAFLLLATAPLHAQSLPDWARPADPTAFDAPESNGSPLDELAPFVENELMVGPELPGVPPPVPIDGGLGLLALAGAGYAARRLRRSS